MKAYLLFVNPANGILSDMVANTEFEYYLQGTVEIKKGDCIAGYIGQPVGQIRMLLEATRDSKSNILYFRKLIDVYDGVKISDHDEIRDAADLVEASDGDIVEIDVEIYEKIKKWLLHHLCVAEDHHGVIDPYTGYVSQYPRNRIFFGAPGTGKSYTVNKDRQILLGVGNESDYERVTFHPDYSYANFVGTYKPVPYRDSDGKDSITYEYVPGPFMRVLAKALGSARKGEKKPYLLIIEEINRANVAAVFGDIFQLLDRGSNHVSEYPIQASEDIKNYLAKPEVLGGTPELYSQLRIPDNMFIWATMNSADQGVYPMDTAFKRRWEFCYIGIDDNDSDLNGKTVVLGNKSVQRVEWNKLRKSINNFLAKQKINEDKQLGPYFLSRDIVVPATGNEIDSEKFAEVFKNKVIMYLFEDAARQRRALLFEGCFDNCTRYSEICKEFDEKGIGIFNAAIQNEAEPVDIKNEPGR